MLDPRYLYDFKDFKYREELIPRGKTEKDEFFIGLANEFAAEVVDNDKVKTFLSRFYGNEEIERFARDYARKKAHLIRFYPYYVQQMNQEEIEQLNDQKNAQEALKALLQKKLFNLEQQWRANRIKIEEQKYIDRYREEKQKNSPPPKPAADIPEDERPPIYNQGHEYADCARLIETDKCIRYLFDAYNRNLFREAGQPDRLDLEAALGILRKADRPIHFDPDLIWHEALFRAAFCYKNERMAEHLDEVFEQYQMMRDLGMRTEKEDNQFTEARRRINCDLRNSILSGRKLCGEPANFDF